MSSNNKKIIYVKTIYKTYDPELLVIIKIFKLKVTILKTTNIKFLILLIILIFVNLEI